jgi:hypothetical protein
MVMCQNGREERGWGSGGNGRGLQVARNVLIVIELVAGVGALAAAVRALVLRRPRVLQRGAVGRFAIPLLAIIGVALICSAALLLAGVTKGRLISVEAGVFFTAWVAGNLALAGVRHWLQFLALAFGVAIVVLALLLPCPG